MKEKISIYTVMFIGHRYILSHSDVYMKLINIINRLIDTYRSIDFIVGSDGDFDTLAASAVQKIKNETEKDINLILVLPYRKKDIEYFEKYYDEVEICAESSIAHFKAAIGIRNKCMVDRSDIIIAYVEHQSGGAYQALKYAQSMDKEIINLAEE